MRRQPLAKLLALYSAIAARHDLKPKGPTYVEQEILEALEKIDREKKLRVEG